MVSLIMSRCLFRFTMAAFMAVPRELSKPPITEALVGIRAAVSAPVTAYETLSRELQSRYPKVEQRRSVRTEWKIEDGKVVASSGEDLGFQGTLLRSEDGRAVVQFRPDGFTFNNLHSYMGGDRLIAEALRLWELFVAHTQPVAVSRVALRFINQLRLPFRQDEDFSRFLTAAAQTPEGSPQFVSEFLSRVVAQPNAEDHTNVIMTQQFIIPEPNASLLVIDVDAYREGESSPNSSGLRPVLDELRGLKNRTFFSLLTDEAVDLYV